MGPESLAQVLSPLNALFSTVDQTDLLIGIDQPDDAAVYQVDEKTAIIATLDFFAPVVDDPWTYGAIAAANAMSDVYAMGGEVVLALNIAGFPEDLEADVVSTIFRGAAEKVLEAGGVIAGGHTVWDEEPKFGLSVLGKVDPHKMFLKSLVKPNDYLYITKPLGTGLILTAARNSTTKVMGQEEAVESMLVLNRHASHLVSKIGASAATDITGFGLLGHLWEMLSSSGCRAVINSASIPLLAGAYEAAKTGVSTGGAARNRKWLEEHLTFASSVSLELQEVCFDPQTSGGLIIAVPEEKVVDFEQICTEDGQDYFLIGSAQKGDPHLQIA